MGKHIRLERKLPEMLGRGVKGRTLPTIGWHASGEGVCVDGARFA